MSARTRLPPHLQQQEQQKQKQADSAKSRRRTRAELLYPEIYPSPKNGDRSLAQGSNRLRPSGKGPSECEFVEYASYGSLAHKELARVTRENHVPHIDQQYVVKRSPTPREREAFLAHVRKREKAEELKLAAEKVSHHQLNIKRPSQRPPSNNDYQTSYEPKVDMTMEFEARPVVQSAESAGDLKKRDGRQELYSDSSASDSSADERDLFEEQLLKTEEALLTKPLESRAWKTLPVAHTEAPAFGESRKENVIMQVPHRTTGTARTGAMLHTSSWVHGENNASPGKAAPEPELSAAIRRWQLHKGRNVRSSGSQACRAGAAAKLAGVGPDGVFVPMLVNSSFDADEDGQDGGDRSSNFGGNDNIFETARIHSRLIARCFVRWQRFVRKRKEQDRVLTLIQKRRKAGAFRAWLGAYHACRMHRLKVLFDAFVRWSARTSDRLQAKQRYMMGETLFELRHKQRTLATLAKNVVRRADDRKKRSLAHAHARRAVLQKSVNAWAVAAAERVSQESAEQSADLIRRARLLQNAVSALRRNVGACAEERRIDAIATRFSRRRALCALREFVAEREERKVKVEAATLVHEVVLCRQALVQWRERVRRRAIEQRVIDGIKAFRLRRALRWMRRFAQAMQRGRRLDAVAEQWFFSRHSLATLAVLAERTLARQQLLDAQALDEIQLARRALVRWRAGALLRRKERRGALHWAHRQQRLGLGALHHHLLGTQRDRGLHRVASLHLKNQVLCRHLEAWADHTCEAQRQRTGVLVATSHASWVGMRKAFNGWARLTQRGETLARAYQRARAVELARRSLAVWRTLATQGKADQDVATAHHLRRLLVAWQKSALEQRYARQSLRTAAIFRRSKLQQRCFTRWVDAFCLLRSERTVEEFASQHADRRLLTNVVGAWAATVRRYTVPWKVTGEFADKWSEHRLLKRAISMWKHKTKAALLSKPMSSSFPCKNPRLSKSVKTIYSKTYS